jgi:hypothetical protein
MILCPNCQNTELTGALYCSECGAKLVNLAGSQPNGDVHAPPGSEKEQLVLTDLPVAAGGAAVTLLLVGQGTLLPLVERAEYTIGRANDQQSIVPDVDLAPYGGYEQGVSRLHASILVSDSIAITDLGSINGTRVNGQLLLPNAPHTLRHEDLLSLGKMKVQVLIRNR